MKLGDLMDRGKPWAKVCQSSSPQFVRNNGETSCPSKIFNYSLGSKCHAESPARGQDESCLVFVANCSPQRCSCGRSDVLPGARDDVIRVQSPELVLVVKLHSPLEKAAAQESKAHMAQQKLGYVGVD